jgi:hypothetical protein
MKCWFVFAGLFSCLFLLGCFVKGPSGQALGKESATEDLLRCVDSDGGKDYNRSGSITLEDETQEYDECGLGAYEAYVFERYCTSDGSGVLNHKCPYECSDGHCNPQPQESEKPSPISGYVCSYNAYNCSDFKTRAEAQAAFEACGGSSKDIHYLDADKDGIACESLR